MIPEECKRLAEVDFPIAEVSRHAAREKSIRHGHTSTLHLWWARRPLASCRRCCWRCPGLTRAIRVGRQTLSRSARAIALGPGRSRAVRWRSKPPLSRGAIANPAASPESRSQSCA